MSSSTERPNKGDLDRLSQRVSNKIKGGFDEIGFGSQAPDDGLSEGDVVVFIKGKGPTVLSASDVETDIDRL